MKCLIWRQHRWQLLWTGLFLAVLCGLAAWVGVRASQWITNYSAWLRLLRAHGCPLPDLRGTFTVHASCHALLQRYPNGFQVAFGNAFNFAIPAFEEGVPLALAVIGALIGAPLVAREIEQRTQLVSWTQSASRRRWFVTKVVVIAAALAAVGLIAGIVTGRLEHPLTQGGLTSSRWVWFYSSNLALAGEIVVAFASGGRPRGVAAADTARGGRRMGRLPPTAVRGGLGRAEPHPHAADELPVTHRRRSVAAGGCNRATRSSITPPVSTGRCRPCSWSSCSRSQPLSLRRAGTPLALEPSERPRE